MWTHRFDNKITPRVADRLSFKLNEKYMGPPLKQNYYLKK